MELVWAIVLYAVLVLCWVSNLFGLPGNWAMIIITVAYWWFMPAELRLPFHWGVLVGMGVLALLGEVIEFVAGAAGAAKAGGSKRGAALAMIGSLAGGLVGVIVGLPIPLIGSVAAALVFASLGAMGGAMLGEHWKGRTLEDGFKVGNAAFWGRLWGTLGKIACGAAILLVVATALIF